MRERVAELESLCLGTIKVMGWEHLRGNFSAVARDYDERQRAYCVEQTKRADAAEANLAALSASEATAKLAVVRTVLALREKLARAERLCSAVVTRDHSSEDGNVNDKYWCGYCGGSGRFNADLSQCKEPRYSVPVILTALGRCYSLYFDPNSAPLFVDELAAIAKEREQ